MFDSYTDIFNRRGQDYHRAMTTWPCARRAEFETALSWLDLAVGKNVCDVPSGGGYLGDFLVGTELEGLHLSCVETSAVFARSCPGSHTTLCERVSEIPFENGCFDRVLSLAGVHHLASKAEFFREVSRLLRPETGRFVLADVLADSPVDGFLNGFVHEHSSMGHEGDFLTPKTAEEMSDCGLQVVQAALESYQWVFPDEAAMVTYCTWMFGIDQATPEQVLAGIAEHLGYTCSGYGCAMNWQLYFLLAKACPPCGRIA